MENEKYKDSDGAIYQRVQDSECSFGPPDGNPQEENKEQDAFIDIRTVRSRARGIFSTTHLLLFCYLFISSFLVKFIGIFFTIILPEEIYTKIFGDMTFNLVLSSIVQYLIAFPLFLFITSRQKRPTTVRERRKMPLSEFLWLLLISEGMMLIGAIIGSYASKLIGHLFSVTPENMVDSIVSDTPMWLVAIVTVIIAPVVEELMYRKIMIDRLSDIGEGAAIIFSALAFGFMHQNLYQLFYATMLGFVLGYIYTRTRNIGYTIAVHMILNFFGSVVTLPFAEAQEWLTEADKIIADGGAIDEMMYTLSTVALSVYSFLQYALMLAGIIALILYIALGRVRVEKNDGLKLSAKDTALTGCINIGSILFYAECFGAILLTFLLPLAMEFLSSLQ